MAIAERRRILAACDAGVNEARDILALALGDRCDAGKRAPVGAADAGRIADSEDIAVTGTDKSGSTSMRP